MPASSRPGARWFAFRTRARHEKAVHRRLAERGLESFLPLLRVSREWTDRRREVETVVFPGYLFAALPPEEVGRVVALPGVVGVVSQGSRPAPVPAEEIENVRRFLDAAAATPCEARPALLPEQGARVRITDGPFAGVQGVVESLRGRSRVLVGLQLVASGLEIDIDAGHLEVLHA
jgi:transcriptional antiterminator RfaH